MANHFTFTLQLSGQQVSLVPPSGKQPHQPTFQFETPALLTALPAPVVSRPLYRIT